MAVTNFPRLPFHSAPINLYLENHFTVHQLNLIPQDVDSDFAGLDAFNIIKGERRSASVEEVMFTKHSRVELCAPICSQPILNLTYRDNWGQMTDEGSCECSTWTTYIVMNVFLKCFLCSFSSFQCLGDTTDKDRVKLE